MQVHMATHAKAGLKRDVEIERLLNWAYRDELSKRMTSSAEGIWQHMGEYVQRGGIDVGHGFFSITQTAHSAVHVQDQEDGGDGDRRGDEEPENAGSDPVRIDLLGEDQCGVQGVSVSRSLITEYRRAV